NAAQAAHGPGPCRTVRNPERGCPGRETAAGFCRCRCCDAESGSATPHCRLAICPPASGQDEEHLADRGQVFPCPLEPGGDHEAVAGAEDPRRAVRVRQSDPTLEDMAQLVIVAIATFQMRLGGPDSGNGALFR